MLALSVRRLIIFAIIYIFLVQQSVAAYTGSAVMEMRTTGSSNLNSGVFDLGASAVCGTDRSQQDASQANGTDLASSNGNVSTPTVTSAGHAFDNDICNTITVSAGTNYTVSVYVIVSTVAGGGAVLDKAVGTAASLTLGTWRMGGAYPGGNATAGISDDARMELMTPGTTVYAKTGTYTLNAVSVSAAGTTTGRIKIVGYNSARGDNPTGSSRPVFAFGANAFALGAFWDILYVGMTSTAAAFFTPGTNGVVAFCKIQGNRSISGQIACSLGASAILMGCEVICFRGFAVNSQSAVGYFYNYIHDSDVLIRRANSDTSSFVAVGNILEGGTSYGIQNTGVPTGLYYVAGNTIYGAENKLGRLIALGGASRPTIFNNILYGGVYAATSNVSGLNYYDEFNDYYNNTVDVSSWTKGQSDISINPSFTNVAQVIGTHGAFVAGNNKIVDTTVNFISSGVVAGDCVMTTAGTGVLISSYPYLIDSITTTTNSNDTLNITLPAGPGTDTTADKTYQITIGHNFLPTGTIAAYPGIFLGGFTTSSQSIGAVQKQASAGGTGFPRTRIRTGR